MHKKLLTIALSGMILGLTGCSSPQAANAEPSPNTSAPQAQTTNTESPKETQPQADNKNNEKAPSTATTNSSTNPSSSIILAQAKTIALVTLRSGIRLRSPLRLPNKRVPICLKSSPSNLILQIIKNVSKLPNRKKKIMRVHKSRLQ